MHDAMHMQSKRRQETFCVVGNLLQCSLHNLAVVATKLCFSWVLVHTDWYHLQEAHLYVNACAPGNEVI